MAKVNDPLEPVARYEFLEARKEMEVIKRSSDAIHEELVSSVKDINKRLETSYHTKDGVRDQFKIELSDYRAVKAILVSIGLATLGLVFAVVQQYIINSGAR